MLPLVPVAALIIARLMTAAPLAERFLDRVPALLPTFVVGLLLLAVPLFDDRLVALRPGLALPSWLLALGVGCGVLLLAFVVWILRARIETDRIVAAFSAHAVALIVALHVGLLAFRPAFDVTPIAALLARAEADGRPVALLGDYEDQFHFAGRLTRPITEVNHTTALTWVAQNPGGLLITFQKALRQDTAPAYQEHYRGVYIVIWHARDVIAHGPVLLSDLPH
jgi:hypothetical protein